MNIGPPGIRTHYAFSRAVPLGRPPETQSLVAYSIKVEEIALAPEAEPFFGVLALDGQRLVCIPAIRRDSEGYIFHENSVPLGPHVLALVDSWLRAVEKPLEGVARPWLRTFASDPVLDEMLANMATPATPVLPGFTNDANLYLHLHRYMALAAYASGRNVLDLRSGSGYGLLQIAHFAKSISYEPGNALAQAVADRAQWQFSQSPARPDLVVAFGLDAREVPDVLADAQARGTSGALVFVSARGDEGREALQTAGLEPTQLSMQPFPSAYPEWVALCAQTSKSYAIPQVQTRPPQRSPQPLAIAFVLRPDAKNVFGGDVVQVQRTAAALRARGHRVEVLAEAEPDVEGFDIVNATGLTIDKTIDQLRAIGTFDGPIVLMTIFADYSDEAVWGMWTHPAIFALEKTGSGIAAQIDLFVQRRLTHPQAKPPPARTEIAAGITRDQLAVLDLVDHMICNAYTEVHALKRYFRPDVPFDVIPSCVDTSMYGPQQRAAFAQRYGLEDFILMAGRFENRKNQLLFFEAVRKMDRTVVCVGKAYDPNYGGLCSAYCPSNAVVIPEMPESEFAGAVAAARVVVVPSWGEVVSLTSLNAAVSRAGLVLTRNGYEFEYLRDDAEYCDPADPASIASAIDRAWNAYPARQERRVELAARVESQYTWAHAAEMTERVYYKVLENHRRTRVS